LSKDDYANIISLIKSKSYQLILCAQLFLKNYIYTMQPFWDKVSESLTTLIPNKRVNFVTRLFQNHKKKTIYEYK